MTEASATDIEAFLKASASVASDGTSEEKSIAESNLEEEEEMDVIARRRSLLSRIDDLRQSYNRTHGQVCEFLDRARTIQKLGLLDPNQTAPLVALSGDEADDDDNSVGDCNYADGQKTTGMKRKLRKWRKVMRSALMEICPGLGLEGQPDINPGLMKHILEEVRSLKSQLAYQHSDILQLAHKTEMFRLDSEHKEQFIADLLQNCKGIRLDSEPNGSKDVSGEVAGNLVTPEASRMQPLPTLSDIQFGRSKEAIETLKLNADTMTGVEADHLVVDPIDFAAAHKQIHLLAKQNEAARNVAISPHTTAKPSSSTAAFLSNAGTVCRRGPTAFDISSHITAHDFSTEYSAGSESTSAVAIPTRRDDFTSKRHHFLRNVGGSLTVLLFGGLAVNSMQRRGKQ